MPRARVIAVVQARTGSTRLPAKVLRPLGDSTVLGWVVRAARQSPGVDDVVVATSTAQDDQRVADSARELGVQVVRGSETDVLSRFLQALDEHPADGVVRLTADCPLLDPTLIGQAVAAWRADPVLDYVSTTLVRNLPRGLDVEVASADVLRTISGTATGYHRTHVTSAIYSEPSSFQLCGLLFRPRADDLRVTLDTPEDAALIEAVVAELGAGPFPWREVVALLRSRPDLAGLNSDVVQKRLEEG